MEHAALLDRSLPIDLEVERPRIVAAAPHHLAAITRIYRTALSEGLASFEDPIPDLAEMARRMAAAREVPWLVALEGSKAVLGYAQVKPFRDRAGWRHVVEDSIYVDRGAQGRGVGRALLDSLIELCSARGFRQMIAVVSDTRNVPSIRLHEQMGFSACGYLPGAGWRADGPVDAMLLQRALQDAGAVGHA